MGISRDAGDLILLPVSPIRSNSLDVAVAAVADLSSGTIGERDVLQASPPSGLTPYLLAVVSAGAPTCSHRRGLHGSPSSVPHWHLARDGPFLTERTVSALDSVTAARFVAHIPTGEFGVPLHHPQFLEWIGTAFWI